MVLKISCKIHLIPSRGNCIGSEENTHGQTDIYYIPPSRWIAGGIQICAVSNFINTVKMFGGGMIWGGGVIWKGIKGEKGTFTKYVDFF